MKVIDLLTTPGVHEQHVRKYFGERAFFTSGQQVFAGPLVLLAFSNRSGSNLLGDYLRSAGFPGFHEQLNYPTILTTADREQLHSFPDYIKFAARGSSLFGVKASTDQIAMALRLNIANMFSGIKVIHIVRTDAIGQAISFSIADQTKQWTSEQAALPGVEPRFRYDDISRRLNSALAHRIAVPFLCQLFSIPYLCVFYEGLIANPHQVMQKIGEFLGHDLTQWTPPAPTISKQANELNDQFKRQFAEALRKKVLKV